MKIGHLFVRTSEVIFVEKNFDPAIDKTTFWLHFRNKEIEQIFPKEGELEILQQHMELYDRKLLTP